jgi:hypothetical protein
LTSLSKILSVIGDITRLGYQALAVRYDLGTLKQGGDFQFNANGGLTTTRDGSLQLGDETHNALHRLLVRWQFNAPALKMLFDYVVQSSEKKSQYESELNDLALRMHMNPNAIERWHDIRHEMGVEEYGPEAYAGTIMVVISALLRREWKDLNKPSTWDTAGTSLAGHSFGAVVEAAANNFRHFDEWAAAKVDATEQPMKSIRVLASVLGLALDHSGKRHSIRTNVCPEILMALSSRNFETLMEFFLDMLAPWPDCSAETCHFSRFRTRRAELAKLRSRLT